MVTVNHAFQEQTTFVVNNLYRPQLLKVLMFHQLNCKSSYIRYLLEYLQRQLQYIGKSETQFNIRFNSHRKDVTRKESIPASNHFNIEGHNFNIHAKFILNQKNLIKKIWTNQLFEND